MTKLTPPQRATLQYVARRPRCQVKELAYELGVSESAAYSRADTLRLKGLVSKPMGVRSFALTRAGAVALAGQAI